MRNRKSLKPILLLLCFEIAGNFAAIAQQIPERLQPLFTLPKHYVIHHTDAKITMDGQLNEHAWTGAQWSDDFVDIEGSLKPTPRFRTQVKMLWNDSLLFIAAQLQEPQVWAKQRHHDNIIYHDNDFEVFIDPDNDTHQYFEIEINALNKIFDLFLTKPYRNQGDALISWDIAGLKSGVQVQGTLNKTNDTDRGWTVEMAVPLRAMRMGFMNKLPAEGTLWRINFSRVEWTTKVVNGKIEKVKNAQGRDLPEDNWVWSPQGLINMHYPERWGYLQFTRKADAAFELPYAEKQKQQLWLIYYLQKEYQQKHHQYADNLEALGIASSSIIIDNKNNTLLMEATARQFSVSISADAETQISINDEGLIKTRTDKR